MILVSVFLKLEITCSYPQYENGWQALAKPNGDLVDLNTKRELAKIVIAQIKGNGSKISIILNEKLPTENISKISP